MYVDYLIIGAGVAGTTAAQMIRTHDKQGSILLIGDEPHALYSRVMLPMVVDGRIPAEKAYLKTDEWYAQTDIKYMRGVRVSRMDAKAKIAWLDDGTEISFAKALIATGGRPKRLDVPGADLPGIHRLQYIEDAITLSKLSNGLPAVVIGGGFIALEFVNAFRHFELPTTLALRRSRMWERILPIGASVLLESHLEKNGVAFLRNAEPIAFVGEEKVEAVKFVNGETILASHVGIGIGLEPNLRFVENVERSTRGVVVNEYLESSVSGVYAAGDSAEFFDLSSGVRHTLGNWFNAREQGRTVGATMAGERAAYNQVSSYSITALKMNVAMMGDVQNKYNEMIERTDGVSYACFYLHEGKLRGGIFINRVADRKPSLELIKQGKDISKFKKELANPNFDLNQLVV